MNLVIRFTAWILLYNLLYVLALPHFVPKILFASIVGLFFHYKVQNVGRSERNILVILLMLTLIADELHPLWLSSEIREDLGLPRGYRTYVALIFDPWRLDRWLDVIYGVSHLSVKPSTVG